MKSKYLPVLGAALCSLFTAVNPIFAQGTAFTYTGRLNDNGVPVNGSYDLRFTIYDVNVAGNVIAGPLPVSPVDVVNGLFTVRLDLGAGVFTGPPRWLNIEVRPVGGANFTPLEPRQEVTSSPYAIRAATAGSVANGTVAAGQLNTAGVAPAPGQILSYDGGNLFWRDPAIVPPGAFSLNGTTAYYDAGNVGIGTSTPAHRLSLNGGPGWTANGWIGALELPHIAAIGWRANAAGQRFGMGHTDTGFYMFRTASDPGTIGSPAIYDFTINDLGSVGIGTTDPSGRLQVKGDWSGEQGALQLSGHRPTLRFTGDADSGNESWLLHLGGVGPGNLGFFRRTGPAAWSPVMQLTTSGRQMEIYGQDALGLIGYQPFLTLFDTSSGNVASRIQAANGDLILETASYIAGQFDTGLVLKNTTGNVGIGTLTPTSKLDIVAQDGLAIRGYQPFLTLYDGVDFPIRPARIQNVGGSLLFTPTTGLFFSLGTPALTVSSGSGNVGVGTTTPQAKLHVAGNVKQGASDGGFVKAMAFVDPFLPAAQYVVRCYNSQQSGATCGITVTRSDVGFYTIDFGFNVENRFISLTPQGKGYVVNGDGTVNVGTITGVSGNQVSVTFFQINDETVNDDCRFHIVVY